MTDGTVGRRTINAIGAQGVLGLGIAEAEAIGVPMAIAVVDDSAHLKAFLRMDGAPLVAVDRAFGKARTASRTGMDTETLYEVMATDPALVAGLLPKPDVVAIAGGQLILLDGAMVGAVGVSGGTPKQDAGVAQVAARALEIGQA